MLTTNDALPNAFNLLASIVRELCSSGRRRALGATLKPEFFRRSGLTEQRLGFVKFGDFLRAAEREGFVQVIPTPGGDLEVWPANELPKPAQQMVFADTAPLIVPTRPPWSPGSGDEAPIRVRPDLWNGFTSFSTRWVYDAARDLAFRATDTQAGSSSGTAAHLIQIPAARERTKEWMRSFADMQDSETKARLLGVLEGDSAPNHFTSLVRSDFRLYKPWHRYHVRQVVAAIETWAASNNVRPKDVTSPYMRTPRVYWSVSGVPVAPVVQPVQEAAATSSIPVTSISVQGLGVSTLTPRLATLIDQLIDELLRLRGTLQVMDPKH